MNKISCNWVKKNLSAYLDKELDSDNKSLIDKHLDRCPSCRQFYLELQSLRQTLNFYSKNLPSREAPQAILEGVSLRLPKHEFGIFTDSITRRAVVAVAMVVILLVVGVRFMPQPGVTTNYAKAYPGAIFRGNLPAGLKVQLNKSNSVLLEEGAVLEAVALAPSISVNLKEGRALFLVRGVEFTVVTPQAQIEVLGTKFRVSAEADRTQVEVLQGIVQVKSIEGELLGILKQSESAVILARTQITGAKQQSAQTKGVIFWREIK